MIHLVHIRCSDTADFLRSRAWHSRPWMHQGGILLTFDLKNGHVSFLHSGHSMIHQCELSGHAGFYLKNPRASGRDSCGLDFGKGRRSQ